MWLGFPSPQSLTLTLSVRVNSFSHNWLPRVSKDLEATTCKLSVGTLQTLVSISWENLRIWYFSVVDFIFPTGLLTLWRPKLCLPFCILSTYKHLVCKNEYNSCWINNLILIFLNFHIFPSFSLLSIKILLDEKNWW